MTAKTVLKWLTGAFVCLTVVGYSAMEVRNLIEGPRVVVYAPENGTALNTPLATVTGQVRNATSITLNNRSIYINESGEFKEEVLLYEGVNSIHISATDRFNHTVEKEITVVYRANETPAEQVTFEGS